jgi:hypothetical protein
MIHEYNIGSYRPQEWYYRYRLVIEISTIDIVFSKIKNYMVIQPLWNCSDISRSEGCIFDWIELTRIGFAKTDISYCKMFSLIKTNPIWTQLSLLERKAWMM